VVADEVHNITQPRELCALVEAQAWLAQQLRLDRVTTVVKLLAHLVHDLESALSKLVEHNKLVLGRVREEPIDHALVDSQRCLRVRQVLRHVRERGKASARH
jgi:hypothetical protein